MNEKSANNGKEKDSERKVIEGGDERSKYLWVLYLSLATMFFGACLIVYNLSKLIFLLRISQLQ